MKKEMKLSWKQDHMQCYYWLLQFIVLELKLDMSERSAWVTAAAVYSLWFNYAIHVFVWRNCNNNHISNGFSAHTLISREPSKSTAKPSWLSTSANDVNQIISTAQDIEWRLIAITGALEMQRRTRICEGEHRGGWSVLSFKWFVLSSTNGPSPSLSVYLCTVFLTEFKKHFPHTVHYCCSSLPTFLKRVNIYKAHRSEKCGELWLASYPVRCDWPNTSSMWAKCYAPYHIWKHTAYPRHDGGNSNNTAARIKVTPSFFA